MARRRKQIATADFGSLFRAIARATLASTCAGACVAAHDGESHPERSRRDEDADVRPGRDETREERTTTEDEPAEAPPPPPRETPESRERWQEEQRERRRSLAAEVALDGYSMLPCEPARGPSSVSELRTPEPLDYLEVRRLASDSNHVREAARYGDACAGVSNADACQRAYEAVVGETLCLPRDCPPFFVVGRGGKFARAGADALGTLLGAVDTPGEALLVGALHGHPLRCADLYVPAHVGTLVRPVGAEYELMTTAEDCGEDIFVEQLRIAADGSLVAHSRTVLAHSDCVIGRRPAGVCSARETTSRTLLGSFLAKMAALEAASVHAFRQLSRELALLGAPRALITAAERAASDETKHARAVARLARRFGANAHELEVELAAPRTRLQLALDNAVEGCVRETFGALVATYQAATARDAAARNVLVQIARDETRHAQFSWQLRQWLVPQLAPAEQRRVQRAQRRALSSLREDLDCGLPPIAAAAIGYPSPEKSAELLDGMVHALFA